METCRCFLRTRSKDYLWSSTCDSPSSRLRIPGASVRVLLKLKLTGRFSFHCRLSIHAHYTSLIILIRLVWPCSFVFSKSRIPDISLALVDWMTRHARRRSTDIGEPQCYLVNMKGIYLRKKSHLCLYILLLHHSKSARIQPT